MTVRCHHLVKTFCGWRDQQLRDGTVIWTSPAGEVYVTTPGSALLFPTLCAPTVQTMKTKKPPKDRGGDRTAKMPTRRRTRSQNRAARVTAERKHNRDERLTRRQAEEQELAAYIAANYEPPPF